ncbi:glycoside hydrolase family 9 protein [Butyrivibrio sp. INlla21]|uniref:glycoside hydrolase family 9 protein n=1 Tax=Butyrivibrio sp. INlla21 TaxID=1520811 RepID=UPI0008E89736|nr:glycoside hydrolase family 9 protein [Butyrivibrio sp. INlla21]SFU73809.1 endoglucanase [Butyrivibrio sp. INlla21]
MFSVMRGKNRIIIMGIVLSVLGSVAGCGASSAEKPVDISDIAPFVQGNSEEVGYEVPIQTPNILVDQNGFRPEDDKVAVFRGKELPETFFVYDADKKKPVYEGKLVKAGYDSDLSENTAIGYFTDVKEEGRYYLYADIVGESYAFTISEDVLEEVFTEACKKFYVNRCGIALSEEYAGENAHSACHTALAHLQENMQTELDVTGGWHMNEMADRDAVLGCKIAEDFLLAFEMNGAAFSDDMGIPESGNAIPDILDEVKYEADWLLKMQDPKTGGVYGAAVTDSSKGGELFTYPVYVTPISMEATIGFASTMAKFSYIYQQYDSGYATTCLKAADRAWTCYFNNQKSGDSTAAFKAAAQLFRATGSERYEDVLNLYFSKNDFEKLFDEDEDVFLGSVTYLSTSQNVDVNRCGVLMKMLMKKSEKIASDASQSSYLVTKVGEEDFIKMLYDMRCLSVTDHIIYNHEYTTIIENHVHYLMGMNPEAMNYVTEGTERTFIDDEEKMGIMNDPQKDALFIFMLGVLRQ